MKRCITFILIVFSVQAAHCHQSGNSGKIQFQDTSATDIIRAAILLKHQNNPEEVLEGYSFKSYGKILIDSEDEKIEPGRLFLSEKVSTHQYKKPGFKREIVEGFTTAGFEDPVEEVLLLKLEPISLYDDIYTVFDASFFSPLAKNALKKYKYQFINPAVFDNNHSYIISFSSLKDDPETTLGGILYFDKTTFALQKAEIRSRGAINFTADHSYEFIEKEGVYFPSKIAVKLWPGTEEKNISILGSSLSVGTVQRKNSPLDLLLGKPILQPDLYLLSTVIYHDFLNDPALNIDPYAPRVKVLKSVEDQTVNYWAAKRKEPFTIEDHLADANIEETIVKENIVQKIELQNAISQGYLPVSFWDFELGRFARYNNYEGFRLGIGGRTNEKFSEDFRLQGYLAYGFKDREFKYSYGGGLAINKRTGTWWDVNYQKDIREIGSFNYLRGLSDFALFEPRLANITYYYRFRKIETGIRHRFTPRLDSEINLSRSEILQNLDYLFLNDEILYRDYIISEIKFGFLWRPFSKFISTPDSHLLLEGNYPIITGQLVRGLENVFESDFSFTKLGLKIDYKYRRLNRSSFQVIMEGNIGVGDLPITHVFHSYPNNSLDERLLQRFSVAGVLSFETMYFNEFFSDKQLALHLKQQFKPIEISRSIRPQLVLISRHVIGDLENKEVHKNISFQTLEHGYSEAGLELNNILAGFGFSFAYRYGAYHLPEFSDNLSFKFTYRLSL